MAALAEPDYDINPAILTNAQISALPSLDAVAYINSVINRYDPPKDITDGVSGWNEQQKHGVKLAIRELFGPTDNLLDWSALGKKTQPILDALLMNATFKQIYDKSVEILDIFSPSGASHHHNNIFIVQDNGSLEIANKPTLLIIPGSVIDPAGKTKTVDATLTGILNLIQHPYHPNYNTLPETYMRSVMPRVNHAYPISNLINMTYNANTYTLNLPTSIGNITDTFNSAFKSDKSMVGPTRFTPSFFAGNPLKNIQIQELLKNHTPHDWLNIVKRYILCKELGDTLQVIWLKHIFDVNQRGLGPIPPPTFSQVNTIVASTDKVVLYRCIVNGVGCIHTTLPTSTASKTIRQIGRASCRERVSSPV